MEYSSGKKKTNHKDSFPQGSPMNVFMKELEETMLDLIDYGGHLSRMAENLRFLDLIVHKSHKGIKSKHHMPCPLASLIIMGCKWKR